VGAGDTRTAVEGIPAAFIPPSTTTGGRRRRRGRALSGTTKTFPRGILRKTVRKAGKAAIHPTRNPTMSKTRKIRIATDSGLAKSRTRAHRRAATTSMKVIVDTLVKRKIVDEANLKNIPKEELRTLYRTSVGAGLL
jgi:hypothetical protein